VNRFALRIAVVIGALAIVGMMAFA